MAGTGSKPEYVGQSALMKVSFLTCSRTSPTMNFNNPLDPVYKAFAVANDCFKVATRTIQIQHEELIRRTRLIGATPEEANAALEDAAKQAADLAILALFATFERFVIEHLQTANRLLAAGYPQQYANKLAEKFE